MPREHERTKIHVCLMYIKKGKERTVPNPIAMFCTIHVVGPGKRRGHRTHT